MFSKEARECENMRNRVNYTKNTVKMEKKHKIDSKYAEKWGEIGVRGGTRGKMGITVDYCRFKGTWWVTVEGRRLLYLAADHFLMPLLRLFQSGHFCELRGNIVQIQ